MKLFKLFGTHYIIGCVPLNNMYWTSANFGGFWNTGTPTVLFRAHDCTGAPEEGVDACGRTREASRLVWCVKRAIL